MCYSAQIIADYRRYVRMFGANMSLREFAILFYERAEGSWHGLGALSGASLTSA